MSTHSNHISEKVAFEPEADRPENDNIIKIELAPEERGHLSIADVFRGTAVHELTPFERKAALINA